MGKLEWIDFFLRLIPESLIIILAGYAVSKKKFNFKLYLLSGVIHALFTFGVRLLPISKFMQMVLSAIVAVILLVIINKIIPLKAILSTLICFILSILFEGVSIIFFELVLKIDYGKIFNTSNPIMKNVYGLPSFLLFASTIIIYFFIAKKREKI